MTKRTCDGQDGFRAELIPPGSGVLCALSGGADSMYLLCRLLEGREAHGWTVQAAHLHHGLRVSAGRDEEMVRRWCAQRGVPLTVGHADAAAYARQQGMCVEEAGRTLRYAFLEDTARQEGLALIATGHHAGDDAETVLMNLVRGCGLKGLTGIPPRRGSIVRPMLGVTRREIEAYLSERGVPHVEDETNADPAYTRNRVRHRLIPLLEELNPQACAHIRAAAARLREDEEELERQSAPLAAQALEIPEGTAVPARVLADAPRPLALRACAMLLEQTGLGGEAVHLERVLALAAGADPSAGLDVPGGSVRRQYDLLVFSAGPAPTPPPPAALEEGTARWGRWSVSCVPAVCPAKAYVSPWEFYLRPGAYLVRSRREGDRIALGRRPEKSVKKLMIEGRVPACRRELVPVLDREGAPPAVGGFGPGKGCLAEPGEPALHIILKVEENG